MTTDICGPGAEECESGGMKERTSTMSQSFKVKKKTLKSSKSRGKEVGAGGIFIKCIKCEFIHVTSKATSILQALDYDD